MRKVLENFIQQGHTGKEIGDALGVSEASVSRWRNGGNPIFPLLQSELDKSDLSGKYVWPDAAKMYKNNRGGITSRFRQVLNSVGISTRKERKSGLLSASTKDFHSLRTTWITLALSAGVPMELVRRVTGHATVDVVLKHYFRPGRDEFRKVLESRLPEMLTGETVANDQKESTREELLSLVESMNTSNWKAVKQRLLSLIPDV